MIFLFMSLITLAAEIPGEELWSAQTSTIPEKVTILKSKDTNLKSKSTSATKLTNSNIPKEYILASQRQSTASELVQPQKGSKELFRGVKVGDIVDVTVPHFVISFPDEKSPVIGLVSSGQLSGIRFIGESYLEKNTKRIFINFSRIVIGHQIFEFKGVGVSSEGQPGITGEHHSREAEYFTGDFIASFAAGYFDGLIPRRTNVFGQTEIEPSVDTAVKKGLASGALSTADRFREKLKKVPEFSEVKGPFNLKILILDAPIQTN